MLAIEDKPIYFFQPISFFLSQNSTAQSGVKI